MIVSQVHHIILLNALYNRMQYFYIRLRYDQNTNTYSDMEGVNVSVPGFGETNTVECLEDSTILCDTISRLRLYNTFVDYFVARGYQRGVTIRAAPYDWRLAASK